MFPIGDDQVKGGYMPVFTWIIIVINVMVFLYQYSLSESGLDAFYQTYAVIPSLIMSGEHWYTLLTSMFMHGGWMHIIGNMLFLAVFGDNIEARVGNIKFLIFYLAAGVIASFAHILTDTSSLIPSLGASGAISGVLGAYLVLFPGARVKMFNVTTGQTFLVPASQFLIYWIGIQLISGIGGLASAGAGDGVAYFAHIGGFVAGWIWAKMGHMLPESYEKGEIIDRR